LPAGHRLDVHRAGQVGLVVLLLLVVLLVVLLLLLLLLLLSRRLADLDLRGGGQRGRRGHMLVIGALDDRRSRRVALGRVGGDHRARTVDLHHVHLLRLL